MIFKTSLLAAFMVITQPNIVMAQSVGGCDNYPYTFGINVEDVTGGTKILATASATVSFDDVDSIRDARDEALLEAKALISKFMSEGIKSDETINKAVNETKSMSGDKKEVVRKEVIERIKRLSSSSQALLRGVVPLGECYTKARELRVSVGIKPETIAQAGNLAGGISKSLAVQPTPSAMSNQKSHDNIPANAQSGTSRDLQNVDSYSNTKRLNKF